MPNVAAIGPRHADRLVGAPDDSHVRHGKRGRRDFCQTRQSSQLVISTDGHEHPGNRCHNSLRRRVHECAAERKVRRAQEIPAARLTVTRLVRARRAVDDDVAGQRRGPSVIEHDGHHTALAERLDVLRRRAIRIHDRERHLLVADDRGPIGPRGSQPELAGKLHALRRSREQSNRHATALQCGRE